MQVDLIYCVACGDGFRDTTEECDDGNMIDGDGCSGRNVVVMATSRHAPEKTSR